jgi:hypothetical protein
MNEKKTKMRGKIEYNLEKTQLGEIRRFVDFHREK